MCAKIGGIPWEISDITQALNEPTMIIGISLLKKQSKQSQRILAITGTLNTGLSQYACSVKYLKYGTAEISEGITEPATSLFEAFKVTNKCYPKIVIVFREGISSGQVKVAVDNEIED